MFACPEEYKVTGVLCANNRFIVSTHWSMNHLLVFERASAAVYEIGICKDNCRCCWIRMEGAACFHPHKDHILVVFDHRTKPPPFVYHVVDLETRVCIARQQRCEQDLERREWIAHIGWSLSL